MRRYFFLIAILFFLLLPGVSSATTLQVGPTSGTFSVGSTFNVSIIVNTEGKSINALSVFLSFPPDKLQVVSPSVGQSIIDVWTVPPKFNNSTGTIELEGGIPGGIIASRGVLTTITFRVRSTGEAILKFSDRSRVLLDDGRATEDLSDTSNGVYQFRLPPPAGPIVVSETHPDQSVWYPYYNSVLHFANEAGGVSGYSYVLNQDPVSVPDNISEGTQNTVVYNELSDGTHYFHVKSLRDGVWGGVTHFAINVDGTSPAEFPVEILPSARTTNTRPIVEFTTTDAHSGIDHYEIKVEPLSPAAAEKMNGDFKPFFIEVTSPHVSSILPLGSYNVVVRAFDRAGNFREVSKKLTVTTAIFSIVQDKGIQIKNWVLVPWMWVWFILAFILAVLSFLAYRSFKWHRNIHTARESKQLPEHVVSQLAELKKYREKYGVTAVVAMFILWSLFSPGAVTAQTLKLNPPNISSVSENITNKEIFYVGGYTVRGEETVVIYSQNLTTGETWSFEVLSDEEGEWFYRHNTFLSPGEYLLWAQVKVGDQFSAPSSQKRLEVERAAIEFGASRLSYETIYLFAALLLLTLIIGLTIFTVFHFHHGRLKYKKLQKEITEAEESVRRGFALIRRDIEAELEILRKGTLSAEMALEEKHREAQLLGDLNEIQKRIGREIWEIKRESW